MKTKKRLISAMLAGCLALSSLAVGSFAVQAKTVDSAVSANAGATVSAENETTALQGGSILQCFNWSYSGIKSNMAKIADQGFTAVQTSPIQTIKESTQSKTMKGSWWVYYQPSNFTIDTSSQNALGTKSDFQAMVTEAHKYGVKVIVDTVLNHMANKSGNDLSDTIPADLRNDSSCWYSITQNTSNWNDRYDITHRCLNGLPDLNTSNSKVQNYAISFLKECIDCDVDGFRFDNAKGIETPDDASGTSSNFWPTVLNSTTSYAQSTKSKTPYYYGEILDSTGGVSTNAYTKYMSLTDNEVSNDIRNQVNNGNASGAANPSYGKGLSGQYAVQWNESHDTYNDYSSSVGNVAMNKTYAIVASRSASSSMYMARPSSYNDQIGTASITAWGNKEVKAVNDFKTFFKGQSEYLSSSGSIAYNERGTTGAVLVNCSGSSATANVSAKKMAEGSYVDQISGNTFVVSGGQIKGQIGATGVAVIYNAVTEPTATITPGSKTFATDTLTLTLNYTNATSGSYSLDGNNYTTFSNGQTISIGSGVSYESTINVYVKATDGSKTSEPVKYTYTKSNKVQKIYFDNTSYNWSSVYAYIYSDDTTVGENVAWPGAQMTKDSSTGYYVVEVPSDFSDGNVIFTESATATTNRYPADMQPGLALEGTTKILKANHSFVNYDDPTPTAVPTTAKPTTAPATTVPSTTAPTEKVLVGDVNGDGNITISDATEIQMHIADMKTLTGNNLIAADVDGDNSVSVQDVTCIQAYLIGLTDRAGKCGTYVGGTEPTTVAPTTAKPTTAPVTQPTTQATGNYIYYTNSSNFSTPTAYYWSTDDTTMTTWPGKAMEKVSSDVYRVEVPSTVTMVIFSNSGSNQTSDISVPGMNQIYNNGSWSPYNG